MCSLNDEVKEETKRGKVCVIGHGSSGTSTLLAAILKNYPDLCADDVELRIITGDTITETQNNVVLQNQILNLSNLILSNDEKAYRNDTPLLEKRFSYPQKRSSRKGKNRRWWDER